MKRIFWVCVFACFFQNGLASHEMMGRNTKIAVAQAYINALLTHEASSVPLAEFVQRFENGVNTGANAAAIRHGLENDIGFKAISNIRDIKWHVAKNEVIAFYLIDNVIPYTKIPAGTTHVVERFQIEEGKIVEIQAIFCMSPGTHPEESKMYPKHHTSILCSRSLI